jgi:hypothetical protein
VAPQDSERGGGRESAPSVFRQSASRPSQPHGCGVASPIRCNPARQRRRGASGALTGGTGHVGFAVRLLASTDANYRMAQAAAQGYNVREMSDRPETLLELARRHVREGEARLARQDATVAELDKMADLGREVRETIRTSLDLAKRHLQQIEERSQS